MQKLPNCKCNGCGEEKPRTDFYANKRCADGYEKTCKKCRKEVIKRYQKNNPEITRQWKKDWEKRNKSMKLARTNAWRRANANKVNARRREIYKNGGKLYLREYRRKNAEKRSSPGFRLNESMRVGVYQSLVGGKGGKKWQSLVGYSLQDLKSHLEKLFMAGMTWDNYGKWHIDHKRPVCSFAFAIASDPEFKKCWALENLQPLWATDNRKKSGKLIELPKNEWQALAEAA